MLGAATTTYAAIAPLSQHRLSKTSISLVMVPLSSCYLLISDLLPQHTPGSPNHPDRLPAKPAGRQLRRIHFQHRMAHQNNGDSVCLNSEMPLTLTCSRRQDSKLLLKNPLRCHQYPILVQVREKRLQFLPSRFTDMSFELKRPLSLPQRQQWSI